jgi:hypothetical protein
MRPMDFNAAIFVISDYPVQEECKPSNVLVDR